MRPRKQENNNARSAEHRCSTLIIQFLSSKPPSLASYLASFGPSLLKFQRQGIRSQHSQAIKGAHLSLNDVEKEVRVTTATQEVAQAKRLVQAFHLLEDVWRRSAWGASARETRSYLQADILSFWCWWGSVSSVVHEGHMQVATEGQGPNVTHIPQATKSQSSSCPHQPPYEQ